MEAMVYILYDASYFSDFTCPSVMFQYFRVLELHLVSFLNSFLCTGEVVLDVLFKNACSTSAYKISLDDYIVPYKRENIIREVSRIIPPMHAGCNDVPLFSSWFSTSTTWVD